MYFAALCAAVSETNVVDAAQQLLVRTAAAALAPKMSKKQILIKEDAPQFQLRGRSTFACSSSDCCWLGLMLQSAAASPRCWVCWVTADHFHFCRFATVDCFSTLCRCCRCRWVWTCQCLVNFGEMSTEGVQEEESF
jgi:hypothetical protein